MKSSRYHGYGVLFTTGISPHHPDLHSNQRKSEPHSQPWRGALFITCTAAASQPQRCLSPPRPPSSPGSSCPQRETQKEAFQTPQANWSRWFFCKTTPSPCSVFENFAANGPSSQTPLQDLPYCRAGKQRQKQRSRGCPWVCLHVGLACMALQKRQPSLAHCGHTAKDRSWLN